jgi:hypothetical protein
MGYKDGVPLALLTLSFLLAGTADRAPDLYHRTLTRALERAQTELEGSLDLTVDHSRWEDPWKATSEHYEVRTTHSYALASEMARNLEFLRSEMVKLLGEDTRPPGKSAIWIFPSLNAYNTFGQPYDTHSSFYGSFYAPEHPDRPVASYYTSNFTQLGMWVTHGAVHQFLDQSIGSRQLDAWIVEGLAGYFALHWDWAFGKHELANRVAQKRALPLERLVGDPIAAYNVETAEGRFLELGMLFHYLLSYCEGTRTGEGENASGPFRDFLRNVVRGQDVSRWEFARSLDEDLLMIEDEFRSCDFAND